MASVLSERIDGPVLLIGRGGSGTRMLSQLAERLGIFLGNEANKSGDSTEWVPLVYRMVAEEGGSRELPTGSSYRGAIREQAQRVLSRVPRRASHLWGLKLPETMLVLPLLIDAFPQAKVVHLIRHPVSSSLRRTHMSSRLNNPVGAVTLPAAYRYAERDVDRIASDEPYLHNAYSWNFQVRRIARYGRATLGDGRYLEIAYEEFCSEPARAAATIGAFLGWTGEGVGAIPVDASRSSDWDPDDPRVEPVWRICGETAMVLGYRRDAATRSPS